MGSENSRIAFIQPFLRQHGADCFSGLLNSWKINIKSSIEWHIPLFTLTYFIVYLLL